MEKVIKNAKEIAIDKKIPLYLSEAEIRRLDREEAVQEGYDSGYDAGIEQKQTEMIVNMYNKKISLETISEISNISIEEVQNIINKNILK